MIVHTSCVKVGHRQAPPSKSPPRFIPARAFALVASSIAWTHDVAHTHFPAHPPLPAAKILACGAMTNSDFLDRRLVATGDGSHSLYLPACNEHYHSSHGALRESQHIFIGCGYDEMAVNAGGRLRILEVGFGTGLNALLTWERCDQGSSAVEYVAIEAFPGHGGARFAVELRELPGESRSPGDLRGDASVFLGDLESSRGELLPSQTADQDRGFRAG
jgi:hypothetical protein